MFNEQSSSTLHNSSKPHCVTNDLSQATGQEVSATYFHSSIIENGIVNKDL